VRKKPISAQLYLHRHGREAERKSFKKKRIFACPVVRIYIYPYDDL